MAESWHGEVVSVEADVAKTELVGTHTAPLSVLQVLNVAGLPESGSVIVGDDTLVYDSKTDTDDPDGTATNDTLLLAAATVNTYAAGAPVTVTPERPFKTALVLQDGASEAVECRVKHEWQDALEEGPRQPGLGEKVEVTRDSRGVLKVTDVLGSPLSRNLGYATPSSLPAAAVDQDDFIRHKIIADLATFTDMTSATITGATIQTARPEDSGRRTWMDQDGFHQTSLAGVPRIDFPTTTGGTNFIRGSANLDNLTLLGAAVARDDVAIAPGGGTITLGTAISDPASAPVSLCDWEGVVVQRDLVPSYGLQRVSGAWYYTHENPFGFSVRTFADDGSGDSVLFTALSGNPYGGVAHLGTEWFTVEVTSQNATIVKYDAAGAYQATRGTNAGATAVIGTDGTDLFVGYCKNGFVHIDTYNTSLVRTAQLTTSLALDTNLAYVQKGSFDFGAARFVVAARGAGALGLLGTQGTAYVLNTSGVEQTAESFPIADSANGLAGMTWDGTNFWSMHDSSPKLYKYTDGCKTDTGDNLTLWVSGDWYQVAGTYHTKVSPAAKVIYQKRSRLQTSMGGVPGSLGTDDPDTTRTFLGRGASDPGPAASYLNATSASDSGDTIVQSPVFSGTTAPTTNTFPDAGAAGRVLAGDGSVILRGTYSNVDDVDTRLDNLEAGGGSTPLGGVDIDCGTASATGVEIDCGVA